VHLCPSLSLSPSPSTQPVEADGRPPRSWSCSRLLNTVQIGKIWKVSCDNFCCALTPHKLKRVYSRYLHQDVEGAGAGPVRAGEEIVEVDAVRVVLLHDGQLEPGLLPNIVLRDVHEHVRAWSQRRRTGEGQKPNTSSVVDQQTSSIVFAAVCACTPKTCWHSQREQTSSADELVRLYGWTCQRVAICPVCVCVCVCVCYV